MASEPSLDPQLAVLRAAAKSMREQRPAWFEHIFHPGRHARRQEDFGAAVVETMKQMIASISTLTAKLAEKEREISMLKSDIAQLREHQERIGRESAETIQSLADRAAEMREQFEHRACDHSEKIEQLGRAVADSHRDLGDEVRERIQHVLDEQRVA